MKMNIQLVAKYITSFVGIALALVICVMPAFASEDGIYNPFDYQTGKPTSSGDGMITYNMVFDTTPLYQPSIQDVAQDKVVADRIEIYPPLGNTKVSVRTYPLGVYASSNSPWPAGRGVIDVRDFKKYSQFDLTANFDVLWTFVHLASGTFELRGSWSVFCYDANGWYTGTIQSGFTSKTIDLSIGSTDGTHFTATGTINLPEGTSYILPMCNVAVYSPATTYEGKYIFQSEDFALSFSIDSVLENTLTMQVIKDQLGDISDGIHDTNDKLDDANNKLDDLINGNPDDLQDAEDNASDLKEEIKDFESILQDIEQYEQIDQAWSADVLASFLNGKGFVWIKDLLSPLLNWSVYSTLMLTILALVNLSLILFGR